MKPTWKHTSIYPFLMLIPNQDCVIGTLENIEKPFEFATFELTNENNPLWNEVWPIRKDYFKPHIQTFSDLENFFGDENFSNRQKTIIITQDGISATSLTKNIMTFQKILSLLKKDDILIFGLDSFLAREFNPIKSIKNSFIYLFILIFIKRPKFHICLGRNEDFSFKIISFKRSLQRAFLRETLSNCNIFIKYVNWTLFSLRLYAITQREHIIVVRK